MILSVLVVEFPLKTGIILYLPCNVKVVQVLTTHADTEDSAWKKYWALSYLQDVCLLLDSPSFYLPTVNFWFLKSVPRHEPRCSSLVQPLELRVAPPTHGDERWSGRALRLREERRRTAGTRRRPRGAPSTCCLRHHEWPNKDRRYLRNR